MNLQSCFNHAPAEEMATHQQVFVKVNAEVDARIASVVSVLNEIDGLQTLESCEGELGKRPAYVYFWFGDWETISRLVFCELAPRLSQSSADFRISVEVFGGSRPTGKIEFSTEAIGSIASALKNVVKNDRSSACSGGKPHTTLRS